MGMAEGVMRRKKKAQQLLLPFRLAHGGARVGSGRKPGHSRLRHTPHRSRGGHRKTNPVHVTLRAHSFVLRRQAVIRVVLGALRLSNRDWFRVVHYSVQSNHIHLIVEAEGASALSTGMRGLAVRVARRVNRALRRRGQFWADRWHGKTLTSPRQTRNALVYVLQNWRKHEGQSARVSLDPCSSAQWFNGFLEQLPSGFHSIGPPCIAPANTWLLRKGFLKHGRISHHESPRTDS